MKKLILSIAGGCLLAALAPAQVTKAAGGGYLLRVKYVKGASMKMSMTSDVQGQKGQPGVGMHFTIPIDIKVLDVKGAYADVQLKLGAAVVKGQTVNPGQTAVVRLDNRNQNQDSTQASANTAPNLPLKPVKVGSKWTAVAPVRSVVGSGTMNATYTFQGLKTVQGRPVAVISYKIAGYVSGGGKLSLLVSDGTLFTNDVQLKLSLGGGAPLVVTSKLVRG